MRRCTPPYVENRRWIVSRVVYATFFVRVRATTSATRTPDPPKSRPQHRRPVADIHRGRQDQRRSGVVVVQLRDLPRPDPRPDAIRALAETDAAGRFQSFLSALRDQTIAFGNPSSPSMALLPRRRPLLDDRAPCRTSRASAFGDHQDNNNNDVQWLVRRPAQPRRVLLPAADRSRTRRSPAVPAQLRCAGT
jgi:hypothetical protein